jgi:hypothetical protein
MNPLLLDFPVLAVSSPSVDPILLLFIPDLFLPNFVLDTLCRREFLPFSRRFGLGQRLRSW